MYIPSGYHLLPMRIFHSHQSVPQFQRQDDADVSHNGDVFSSFYLYIWQFKDTCFILDVTLPSIGQKIKERIEK